MSSKQEKISSKKSTQSKVIIPVIPFSSLAGFESIAEKCDQKKWRKDSYISKGAYGNVYVACEENNCDYVVKIQKADTSFYNEVHALIELQPTKIVPKIYAAWTCKGEGFIVMEKLQKCPEIDTRELFNKMKSNLKKLYKLGWLAVDVHKGNYLCRVLQNGKLEVVSVDFGLSVKKGVKNDMEEYPYHHMSELFERALNWKELEIFQNYYLNRNFNPLLDENDINEMVSTQTIFENLCSTR